MPPPGEPQVAQEQIETIRRWIDARAPADNPELIYGAAFFQTWGTAILIVSGLNLLIITVASSRWHSNGFHVMFAALVPVFLIGLSRYLWYPPDLLSWIACLAIPLGFILGCGMVSVDKGYSRRLGSALGLLSIIGVIALTLLKVKQPAAPGPNPES